MGDKTELIDLLLKQNLITQEEVDRGKEEAKRTGLIIEKALEKLGFITEEDIVNVRARSLGVPYIDLTNYIIDTELVKLVSEALAKKYKIIPLFKIGNCLTIAMTSPDDIVAIDQLRRVSNIDSIDTVLATEAGIQKILDSYYGVAGSVEEIAESIGKEKKGQKQQRSLAESAEAYF